ncbi:hypothetical protein SAMN05421858_3356 [Haladaptatus litoreus]|uniref:Uncharacterized protein n=1 Tax=Haladaptatus litoreus TaxID=553468 RepID=A0A1N7CZI3_9EURY|nr:hypothetical protein SAMN05421858_3356 [Haladaptatus litoreus]
MLFYLGPELVRSISKKKVLATPSVETFKYADGGILINTTMEPAHGPSKTDEAMAYWDELHLAE